MNLEYEELPTWDQCALARFNKNGMTALEEFIFEHEPGEGSEARKWRGSLYAALEFWKEA